MSTIKKHLMKIWHDESGQGATEYILLLVVVVALVFLFKSRIMTAVGEKLGELSSSIGSFTGNN